MPAAVIVGVFIGWLLVSAFCQLRIQPTRRVRRLDWLGLIPRWNFFAPRPIVGDVIVQYRTWTAGAHAEWLDLGLPSPRRWVDAVWPGGRRAKKAAFDAAASLAEIYRGYADRPAAVVGSVPYLLLLGRVTTSAAATRPTAVAAADCEPRPDAVQFRVVRLTYTAAGRNDLVLVRSATHTLGAT